MTAGAPVAVVGAGAAGLLAALRLVERGVPVDLFSLGAPSRGPVASAGRGLVTGDDPEPHLDDALAASAGTADAPALRAMIGAAARLTEELSRLGVPFDGTEDGALVRRAAVGHRSPRLVEAGLSTKFHAVHALDRALRRGATGPLRRFEGWEMIALARGAGGACVGLVAQHLRTMEVRGFAASAVVLASGGFAGAWAGSSAALGAVGTATAAAARAGASLVDPDRIDVHPIALAGSDKPYPMPDALRALGARVWMPKDPAETRRARDVPPSERIVVLEGGATQSIRQPRRDEAARRIEVALAERRAAHPRAAVYLDAVHLGAARLADRLGRAALDLDRAGAEDLAHAPIAVLPAVHATLGGLWTSLPRDDDGDGAPSCATTVAGLFAIGGAAASPTGTTRLAGHRLLHALFGGDRVAGAAAAHRDRDGASAAAAGGAALAEAARRETDAYDRAMQRGGEEETCERVTAAIGEALAAGAGVLREPGGIEALARALPHLHERAAVASGGDRSLFLNRGVPALRRLDAALLLAGAVAAAAQRRHVEEAAPGAIRVRADGPEPQVEDGT